MAARGGWNRQNQNYYAAGAYQGSLMPQQQVPYYMTGGVVANDRRYQNDYSHMNKSQGGGYRNDDRRRMNENRKRPRSPNQNYEMKRGNDGHHDSNRGGNRSHNNQKYDVARIPKYHIASSEGLSLADIRQRMNRMYTPNDLCHVDCNWSVSFPMGNPMSLSMDCDMHVFHKDVESPATIDQDLLSITDCDYSYSVRVMLLGTPSLHEIYKSTVRLADEAASNDKTMATKMFNFLVASRGQGKSDHIALGGPWSPARDGPNPSGNPQTLINTAIRYMKGFLGLDLSSCNEWIRFIELSYHRVPGSKAPGFLADSEREITSEVVEKVIFFIPVISHMLPTPEQWEQLKAHYCKVLEQHCHPVPAAPSAQAKEPAEDSNAKPVTECTQMEDSNLEDSFNASQAGDPTHFSKLDVISMKVSDLKIELLARGLDTKGLKANLVSRLQEALDKEKASEETSSSQQPMESEEKSTTPGGEEPEQTAPAAAPVVDSTTEVAAAIATEGLISDKEKRRLERLYRLPEKPALLIHPNFEARASGSKPLEYYRISLCSLLDHRSDDIRELSFELCLFAQQFNEMLLRDCIFHIFKAFYNAPDRHHVEDSANQNGQQAKDEPELKKPLLDPAVNNNNNTETVNADGGAMTEKIRKHKRTVDVGLLFSFVFFDTGNAEYLRDLDIMDMFMLLNMGYSRGKLRQLILRCKRSKDHVQYRILTDVEVVEGSAEDVTQLPQAMLSDKEIEENHELARGNKLIKQSSVSIIPAKITLGGGGDSNLAKRLEKAESTKKAVEFQFYKLKEELENTRIKLNGFKDIEDKLRDELKDLQARHRQELKVGSENRQLVSAYGRLLREAKSSMDKCLSDINRQFEKEREKREAELKAQKELEEAANKELNDSSSEQKDNCTVKKEDDIVLDTA